MLFSVYWVHSAQDFGLTLYILMDSSFLFNVINLGWSIVYFAGPQLINSKENNIFLLKIVFIIAKYVDHHEMPHYAAFHLGLYCLPEYEFRCRD